MYFPIEGCVHLLFIYSWSNFAEFVAYFNRMWLIKTINTLTKLEEKRGLAINAACNKAISEPTVNFNVGELMCLEKVENNCYEGPQNRLDYKNNRLFFFI